MIITWRTPDGTTWLLKRLSAGSARAGEATFPQEARTPMKLHEIRQLLSRLHREESGQDLIEYALLAALIALAATVGMSTVASDINNAFIKIGSKLSTNVGT